MKKHYENKRAGKTALIIGRGKLVGRPLAKLLDKENVDKIYYGCDNENLYLRLHVNKNMSENSFLDRIFSFVKINLPFAKILSMIFNILILHSV